MNSLFMSARDCSAVVVVSRAGVRFAGFGQSSVVRKRCGVVRTMKR